VSVDTEEVLSESEIEARFGGEYVAVEVLELDEQHVITRGIVIAHGTEKAAVRERLRARNPRQSALLCLAPRPKNIAYLL
jgi:hypothetical protein